MSITREITYIGDFAEAAAEAEKSWGRTDLYQTGHRKLDIYLSGGFGRRGGYEIVLMFGATGVGKSTVALNFMANPIRQGKQVGLLVLEDAMPDVSNRLKHILGDTDYTKMNRANNVRCLPDDALTRSWNLSDLLIYIQQWFDEGVELILLDHLQFAFENAELNKGENEYTAQRVFMRELNQIIKSNNKTIILISHVNKNNGSKGMDKIVGSGSLAQAATKVIEISEGDVPDSVHIDIKKTRFTKKPGFYYAMGMIDSQMRPLA